jgi:hypothetical protein
MMLWFMRHSLIVALIVSSAAAGIAAIPESQMSSGNPLWAIPLKNLSATRERPIFSPSRRAPTPAVVGVLYREPPPARAAAPERPQLSLVGTIVGGKEGFGIFIDRLGNDVIRLKTGEQHKGWILREVRSRETVLEKGDKTTTLSLPVAPLAEPARRNEDEKNETVRTLTVVVPVRALALTAEKQAANVRVVEQIFCTPC